MVVRQQADTATVASNVYLNSHLEQGQVPLAPSAAGARSTYGLRNAVSAATIS
jgi:hypothetical protein